MIRIKIKSRSNLDDGNHKDEPKFENMPPLPGAESWKSEAASKKRRDSVESCVYMSTEVSPEVETKQDNREEEGKESLTLL
eukprot:scaffold5476_cov195-Alexandrium_tamarense.AAC.7